MSDACDIGSASVGNAVPYGNVAQDASGLAANIGATDAGLAHLGQHDEAEKEEEEFHGKLFC